MTRRSFFLLIGAGLALRDYIAAIAWELRSRGLTISVFLDMDGLGKVSIFHNNRLVGTRRVCYSGRGFVEIPTNIPATDRGTWKLEISTPAAPFRLYSIDWGCSLSTLERMLPHG